MESAEAQLQAKSKAAKGWLKMHQKDLEILNENFKNGENWKLGFAQIFHLTAAVTHLAVNVTKIW